MSEIFIEIMYVDCRVSCWTNLWQNLKAIFIGGSFAQTNRVSILLYKFIVKFNRPYFGFRDCVHENSNTAGGPYETPPQLLTVDNDVEYYNVTYQGIIAAVCIFVCGKELILC